MMKDKKNMYIWILFILNKTQYGTKYRYSAKKDSP